MKGFLDYLCFFLGKRAKISQILDENQDRDVRINQISASLNLPSEKITQLFDEFEEIYQLNFEVEFQDKQVLMRDLITEIHHCDAIYLLNVCQGYAIIDYLEKMNITVKPFFSWKGDKLKMSLNICVKNLI